jgi:hypothetical protein
MKVSVLKILLIVFILAFFASCSKELSKETGIAAGGTAAGTLLDSSGNCQHIGVYGTYQMDSLLTDSNYVKVTINFKSAGKYKIYSDTANGFWFLDSAYVVNTGTQTVKVRAHGKPLLPTTTTFTMFFDSSVCNFVVYFIPPLTNSDYFPTTIGSNWTYAINNSSTNTVTYTAKNSFFFDSYTNYTYQLFLSDKMDSSLYRKDGQGNYFTYGYIDDSTSYPLDYQFLKDYAAAGTTWSSAEVPSTRIGVNTEKMNFTIIGTGLSVTYNGKTYSPVIKVKEDVIWKKTSGTLTTYLSDYAYYAKGVGWINTEYINVTSTFTLTSYQVY